MKPENLLMVANSDHDADMLYAVRMFVPEPFIFFRVKGRDHIVLSDSELDRARKQVRHCRVLALSQWQRKLDGDRRGQAASVAHVVHQIAREHRLKRFVVPASFPHGLARELRRLGIRLKVKSGPMFFADREFKSAEEIKKISATLMMAEVGLAEGIHALRNAKIGPGRRLLHHGALLTSEKLRAIIEIAIIHAGGTANQTIVAGGGQACDPHESGHGPLKAHEPIVIDICPRSRKTGYFGDITRTVVKGRASEGVRRLYDTVRRGQELALRQVRPGVSAREVHQAVVAFFTAEGYRTGKRGGRLQGFFHGTGHGLGLEIHEPPRINATTTQTLCDGHVVAIEPGLHFPELGAVRLEDVVHITRKTGRNLAKFEKVLEV